MPILRDDHHDRFTVVSNAALEDPRLSNAAKGLLVRLLSLADGWRFSVRGLAAVCRDGECALRRQLQELEACGYLERRRETGSGNQLGGMRYTIRETPRPAPASPAAGNPAEEIPAQASPAAESPSVEHRRQTKNKQTKTKQTTNNLTILPSCARADGRAEFIAERFGFDMLAYYYDPALLRSVGAVIAEVECGSGPFRINGSLLPAAEVRARFAQLDDEHLRFVLDQMAEVGGGIRSVHSWLLTALYNAPVAMELHISALFAAAQAGRKS